MNEAQSMAQAVIKAMISQGGTVRKAQQICIDYSEGKLTIYQWHDLMTQVHYVDCQGDPIESGWILHECSHLVPQADWDWSIEKDSKDYQRRGDSK